MKKQNEEAVRDATAKAVATQVRRTLEVMRVGGWTFPTEFDIGVRIENATPLSMKVVARIDATTVTHAITAKDSADDLAALVDMLVAAWLSKNGEEIHVMDVRDKSGNVNDDDPFVSMFYSLLRDHLPAGVLEKIVVDIEEATALHGPVTEYTNGWLARYAENLVIRLRRCDASVLPP